MQAINLLVFALHLQFIREDLSKRTLSVRTSLMLNAVLSRFTDFCVSYALYTIPTFMRMCLSVSAWSACASLTQQALLFSPLLIVWLPAQLRLLNTPTPPSCVCISDGSVLALVLVLL